MVFPSLTYEDYNKRFHIPKASHISYLGKKKEERKKGMERKESRVGRRRHVSWLEHLQIPLYLVAQYASKTLVPLKMIREYRLILILSQAAIIKWSNPAQMLILCYKVNIWCGFKKPLATWHYLGRAVLGASHRICSQLSRMFAILTQSIISFCLQNSKNVIFRLFLWADVSYSPVYHCAWLSAKHTGGWIKMHSGLNLCFWNLIWVRKAKTPSEELQTSMTFRKDSDALFFSVSV